MDALLIEEAVSIGGEILLSLVRAATAGKSVDEALKEAHSILEGKRMVDADVDTAARGHQ